MGLRPLLLPSAPRELRRRGLASPRLLAPICDRGCNASLGPGIGCVTGDAVGAGGIDRPGILLAGAKDTDLFHGPAVAWWPASSWREGHADSSVFF